MKRMGKSSVKGETGAVRRPAHAATRDATGEVSTYGRVPGNCVDAERPAAQMRDVFPVR